MTFQDHLRSLATQAITSISAAEAADIYVISFFIDNERDDLRQPTLTIGYNTEAQFRSTIADASDEAEARWNYAFWLQNELTIIGDLTRDPDGAAARHQWISELGLWYDEPTHPEDWMTTVGPTAELIEANFNQACVQLARDLHKEGVIKSAIGKPVPVILHELEYYEGIARRTEAANPPGARRRLHDLGPHRLRHSGSSNTRLHHYTSDSACNAKPSTPWAARSARPTTTPLTHLLHPSSADVAVTVVVKPEDALSSIRRGKGIFVLQRKFNIAKLDHL
ncbi:MULTISPECIES: hypothetical protein [Streptomyces]|uniref:hypothetical protein n=1 Tax=Streptomyces TaxID=1883 RepID=UPI001685D837|nr:hypothetical protein [Streptomyces venezuelae]